MILPCILVTRHQPILRFLCAYFYINGILEILVGKPEGKGPLGRPRRRWVDDVEMDLREIGSVGMDWINLA
jgi:hypothetical protein